MKVANIMTKEVISVNPKTRIDHVATLLFDNNLTGMPVVDDTKKVVGVVTEYDFMNPKLKLHIPTYINFLSSLKMIKGYDVSEYKKTARQLVQATVDEIMTKEVITVHPETDVATVVELITSHRINPIPVVDDENVLVGIVSRADLVKLLKESSLE